MARIKMTKGRSSRALSLCGPILLAISLAGCEMLDAEDENDGGILENAVEPASRSYTFSSRPAPAPSAGIDQIDMKAVEATEQLSKDRSGTKMEQLREYVDLCAPEAPRRADINCDEMKLKMREKYNSDDELFEALKKLDQLTGGQRRQSALEDFNGSADELSPEALAVAGGLLPTLDAPKATEDTGVEIENLEVLEAIVVPNLGN